MMTMKSDYRAMRDYVLNERSRRLTSLPKNQRREPFSQVPGFGIRNKLSRARNSCIGNSSPQCMRMSLKHCGFRAPIYCSDFVNWRTANN